MIILPGLFLGITSCGNQSANKNTEKVGGRIGDSFDDNNSTTESQTVTALLVSPQNPGPGEVFRVMAIGSKNILKAGLVIKGESGLTVSKKTRNGDGLPFWRIDEFVAGPAGKYQVTLNINQKAVCSFGFSVSGKAPPTSAGVNWKAEHGWSGETEMFYSAWINALFYDADERSSWSALHEVTRNRERNFLYNFRSLGEDDPSSKIRVLMEPDCADNPFYLRAYFAWKLGLPFGYHECDRGSLGRSPKAGRWITNESPTSKNQPVAAFNGFIRRVMDGVHSGTARTALKDENSDYYPVPLTREALRPGVVFADPYGHTLILVHRIPQSDLKPGTLLAVDAQPDATVAIKRFWKGNFLFSTTEVIGDPGFKAFRPIILREGELRLLKNAEISGSKGFIPYSLQQQGMSGELFYQTMERIINPEPLDPETALLDLIQALHEQLLVRVNSVATGESYMRSHPGEVVVMPGGTSGVFQAGGKWEDFSTPNRDLRLLIAMDAVLDFPDKVIRTPEDFKISRLQSIEKVKKNLEALMSEKIASLSITYQRTNGTEQTLTMAELLKRREAFEMGYNPNDGVEIRWGAPENSEERSTCKRHAPAGQLEKMRSVRRWFEKRLHPPT